MREIAKLIGGDKVKFDTEVDLTNKTEKEFRDHIESYMELMSYKYVNSFFIFTDLLPNIDNNLRADIYICLIDIDRLDSTYKDSFEVETYNEARKNLLDSLMSIPSYYNKRDYVDFVFSGKFSLLDIYIDVGYTDKEVRDALMGGDATDVVDDIKRKIDDGESKLKRDNLKGLLAGKVSLVLLYLVFIFAMFSSMVEFAYSIGLFM